MSKDFKKIPPNDVELECWKKNPTINPRTKKTIKTNGPIYKILETAHKNNNIPSLLLKCNEDRDPISMNLFWIEENGSKKVVYPSSDYDNLFFYTDSKNITRCFEKESLRYLKSYNILLHPINMELIPTHLFESLDLINLEEIHNNKTKESLAVDVSMSLSNLSIFIEYNWLLKLNKYELCRLHQEIKDLIKNNLTQNQQAELFKNKLFERNNLSEDSLENIHKYLLNLILELLKYQNEEYKYMINYIIVGALGTVIPKVRELYPDLTLNN